MCDAVRAYCNFCSSRRFPLNCSVVHSSGTTTARSYSSEWKQRGKEKKSISCIRVRILSNNCDYDLLRNRFAFTEKTNISNLTHCVPNYRNWVTDNSNELSGANGNRKSKWTLNAFLITLCSQFSGPEWIYSSLVPPSSQRCLFTISQKCHAKCSQKLMN